VLLILFTILTALLAGIFPLFFQRWPFLAKISHAFWLAVSGLSGIYLGIRTLITHKIITYQINTNFPEIILQMQLDPLAAFFVTLLGVVVCCVALYLPGYLRGHAKQEPLESLALFSSLFIVAMYLVLLAHDIFSFMFAWELMSISSYFLVVYHHENPHNRRAAFLYLIMAHLSGILVLFAFAILAKFSGSLSFDALTCPHDYTWATIAFIFALLGFGMKAGVVPLHAWLPQAHPVAPSHVSALMSGVMLKVAIYGLLRFLFSLLGTIYWQWGAIILFVGVITALFGVLYALVQNDLKKLLAYSSIENIGIIFLGIGLTMIFVSTHNLVLGAIGFLAVLYQCLNHALFKSLLFLGAGVVLQYGREHDLERMGGLIRHMPYTAVFFLVGSLSISALPPFNGFISEWLTLQTALQATVLKSGVLRILIPVAAALLVLTTAIACACFVKVYGIAFLGQARSRHIRRSHDPRLGMLLALAILAVLCLLFGIFPTYTLGVLNIIPLQLIGVGISNTTNWLWLVPLTSHQASYSPLLVVGGISMFAFFVVLVIYSLSRGAKFKSSLPWDCGFGGINQRMQYSATGFAMPLRRVFSNVWSVSEKTEIIGTAVSYNLMIVDWLWKYLYAPLERVVLVISRNIARIQGGNIRVYLAYTFFTLILLLWVAS